MLQRTTQWYDEGDGRFVIIECDQCDQPMAVWREHCMNISEDSSDMEKALRRVADRIMGGREKYVITKKQRSIDNHFALAREGYSNCSILGAQGLKAFKNCSRRGYGF